MSKNLLTEGYVESYIREMNWCLLCQSKQMNWGRHKMSCHGMKLRRMAHRTRFEEAWSPEDEDARDMSLDTSNEMENDRYDSYADPQQPMGHVLIPENRGSDVSVMGYCRGAEELELVDARRVGLGDLTGSERMFIRESDSNSVQTRDGLGSDEDSEGSYMDFDEVEHEQLLTEGQMDLLGKNTRKKFVPAIELKNKHPWLGVLVHERWNHRKVERFYDNESMNVSMLRMIEYCDNKKNHTRDFLDGLLSIIRDETHKHNFDYDSTTEEDSSGLD